MSAIICPQCHRHVSLPETDDHSVWVRCPLCHAEYSLQSAVEHVPPPLAIIAQPVPAAVGDGSTPPAEHPADIALDDAFANAVGAAGLENHHPAAEHAGEELTEHPTFEEGVESPFELEASEHAMDAAEHQDGPHQDGDDGFRFADEQEHAVAFGEHDEGELHEGAGDAQAMGSLATMVSTAPPPKKKRKVPLKVKLIGITAFLVIFLVIDVAVYCGLLFFGSDPLNLRNTLPFPKFIVAKSLRDAPSSPTPKMPGGPLASDRPSGPGSKPNPVSQPSDANPPEMPKEAGGASDKGAGDQGKSPAAVTPNPADTAKENPVKPGPDKVSADKEASAFDDPTKTGPADSGPPDLTKINGGIPEPTSKPKSTEPPSGKPATGDTADKTGDKPTEKPSDTPVEKPADKPTEKPVEQPAAVGPKLDATYSLDDASAALDAAKKATAAYAQAAALPDDAAGLKKARIAEFKALSHVATVLTTTKAEGPDAAKLDALKAEASSILAADSASGSGPERDEIGNLSDKWMTSPSRKENGAFVEGTLKKTEAVGKLYQLDVQLFGKPTIVTILVADKPTLVEGTPVSVLGTIVADPAKNVAGYEGNAPTAVWGAVVAPAAK